jgi:hypothetical protein
VKLSRRREESVAEQERTQASSKTEDRPAYAGRLQRLLGGAAVHALVRITVRPQVR